MASDQHFSSKRLAENALINKLFPKVLGMVLATLGVNGLTFRR